jgi:superfamily II DNA/RNA helicase
VSSAPRRQSHGGNSNRNTRNRGRKGDYIDPSRFVKVATASQNEPYVAQNSFADFNLAPLLQANLTKKGYVTPSPIQDQAIPAGLEGRDVIGLASTGTGKTAAFALPVLQQLITDPGSYALIIAPTRELAEQIETECRMLAKGSGLTGALLIGGTGMGPQLRDLRGNPRIVIGTPGRIKDHLQRGTLKLQRFNEIVLDEVDRMLDMGFIHDVTSILSEASSKRQSFFFSATLDASVRTLINTFSNDPVTFSLKASATSDNVHQDVIHFESKSDKLDKLHNLLVQKDVTKVLIFDETQRSVERLYQELLARGFETESIHGGKTQGQRQRALSNFKTNKINVLVATDVAARGIDVADISHVINFSIPRVYDDYIHRIGRAGRAGQIGYALTFVER